MKKILFAAILTVFKVAFASSVPYFNQVEFSTSATQIRIVDAQYAEIATQIETRAIPGCNRNADAGNDCDQTVVLQSEPVVQVNIAYHDSAFPSGDSDQNSYTSLNLPLSAFSAADVAQLQSVYPTWKHPFTTIPQKFAKNHLQLSLVKAQKGVQIVDASRSRICPVDEMGNPSSGCVENLIYKTVNSPALVATVQVK